MAPRSLRPQLNQIRAWVRQGRTDAWIAHQLEIGTSELREFRRQHGLSADDEETGSAEVDLRDEIEAEIEASEAEKGVEEEEEPEDRAEEEESDGSEAEGRPRRRRRRGRRGGRGRRSKPGPLEATFDHGDRDGFGLWLDPAVQENQTYSEHWAGHSEVTVTIEPDQIVIKRAGSGDSGSSDPGPADSDTDE